MRVNHGKAPMEELMGKVWGITAAALAAFIVVPAYAADPVKIGVIYPLTGNAASAGQSAQAMPYISRRIINSAHPELPNLPLGADRRPAESRRRQDRARRGRSPGQSAGRPATDTAAHHRGSRRRHGRLVSFLGIAGRHRRRRAAGHSVPGRGLGSRQHHRARLQMDVPHHALSRPISPRPMRNSSPS